MFIRFAAVTVIVSFLAVALGASTTEATNRSFTVVYTGNTQGEVYPHHG